MISKPSQSHSNRRSYNWLIYDQWDRWLVEYSKYYKGTLVDLGCGNTPYKAFFLQYADSYIGVDWSNTLHDLKADVISDLNVKVELPDTCADTIISLSVMEHLCEPQNFLNESYRILKDDGIMIVQIPWMWWIHEAPYDYFRYSPYGLKYMFEKSGFEEVEVQPMSGFFSMWVLKMNYFSLRWGKKREWEKKLIRSLLKPIWFIAQKIAPKLDSFHRGWSLETVGFFVIARKNRLGE